MSTPERIVLDDDDMQVCRWVWQNLVPPQGQASTLQGELLRAIEKLRNEAMDNGNINWDSDFVKFVDFLERHLTGEPTFSDAVKDSIRADLARLRVDDFDKGDDVELDEANSPYCEDDLYDRICGHIASYCRVHPVLVAHEHDSKLTR